MPKTVEIGKRGTAFAWTRGFQHRGADPDTVGRALERLRRKYKGTLSQEDVVAEARKSKSSALHKLFDWDIREAAEKWWLRQAGDVIRACVQIRKSKPPRRMYASVTVKRQEGSKTVNNRVYVATNRALGNATARAQVLRDAREELDGWTRRYADYGEISGLITAVRAAIRAHPPKKLRKSKPI